MLDGEHTRRSFLGSATAGVLFAAVALPNRTGKAQCGGSGGGGGDGGGCDALYGPNVIIYDPGCPDGGCDPDPCDVAGVDDGN